MFLERSVAEHTILWEQAGSALQYLRMMLNTGLRVDIVQLFDGILKYVIFNYSISLQCNDLLLLF